MKSFLFCLPFLIVQFSSLIAQNKVIGSIIDKTNNDPLEFASITILTTSTPPKAINGSIADEKGNFMIQDIPNGTYTYKVEYSAYKSLTGTVTINSSFTNLGRLALEVNPEVIKAVEITEEKEAFRSGVEKKIYEVGKNLSTTGGNASDALRVIPSVNVDLDGNVSLRGSGNVSIWINGRPTGIVAENKSDALKSIPANQIQSVEVITNPSAKYDAEGGAGIINIILKKDAKPGYSGNINLTLGTFLKINPSLNLGYFKNNWRITTGYSYDNRPTYSSRSIDRSITYSPDSSLDYQQRLSTEDTLFAHNFRLSVDKSFKKGSFGINANYSQSDFYRTEIFDYTYSYPSSNSRSQTRVRDTRPAQSYDILGTFEWSLSPKTKLKGQGSYAFNERDFTGLQTAISTSSTLNSKNYNLTQTFNTVGQLDLESKINDLMSYEVGIKYNQLQVDALQDYSTWNTSNQIWDNNTLFSNDFKFNQTVYAAYAQWSGASKNELWNYQAGLRVEDALNTGDLKETNTSFKNDFLALFPSFSLKYKPKTKTPQATPAGKPSAFPAQQEYFLTYSKRVNRPNAELVNPFPNVSDLTSLRYGSPNLQPEYVHSFEVGFNSYSKALTFTSALFYRRTENAFSRVVYNDSIGNVRVIHSNLGTYNALGGEFMIRKPLTRKWDVMFNVDAFVQEILATAVTIDNKRVVGFNSNYRLMSTYKFTPKSELQLFAMFMTPIRFAQGTFEGMNMINLSYKHTLGKWTLKAGLNDVFDMMQMKISTTQGNFKNSLIGKRETRIFNLTVEYQFGESDKKAPKKARPEGSGGTGGGDFF